MTPLCPPAPGAEHPLPRSQSHRGEGGCGQETSDSAAHLPVPSALCSLLGTWLERYPEHFCQPQDLTCLHQLVAYVQLHMPSTELARRAQRLLTQLEDPEPKEAEAEPKGEEGLGTWETGRALGQSHTETRLQA